MWVGRKQEDKSHIFIRLARGQARATIIPKYCLGGLLYFAIPDRGPPSCFPYEQYFSNGGYELTPRLGNAVFWRRNFK